MSPANIRPTMPDPSASAARMVSQAQAGQQRYVDGASSPRRNAKQAALAATARYKSKMLEALNAGSWEKGIQGYDEDQMLETIRSIGGQAYAQGIAGRADKIRDAFTRLYAKMGPLVQQVRNLPANTDTEREARMLAMSRGMRQIGKELQGQK